MLSGNPNTRRGEAVVFRGFGASSLGDLDQVYVGFGLLPCLTPEEHCQKSSSIFARPDSTDSPILTLSYHRGLALTLFGRFNVQGCCSGDLFSRKHREGFFRAEPRREDT